jgi:hypothetical protein
MADEDSPMRRWCAIVVVLVGAVARADEPAKPNQLTPKEIADGWISLFDGETTFGWKIDGEAKVENGALILGGSKETRAEFTTPFYRLELTVELVAKNGGDAAIIINSPFLISNKWQHHRFVAERDGNGFRVQHFLQRDGQWESADASVGSYALNNVTFLVPKVEMISLRNMKLRPLGYKPIFNGKDLAGWKEFPGKKSKWSVSKEGWIHLEDGPGDLQTEDQWADFILSAECISNGPHCNSGIFFRCIPGQYQQGYEAQIRNEWKDDDRTKPIDFGTGAIYRRQAARKVVSSDHEWFTMTVAAHGNHLATWVNGYQVTDFTDTRPANENARNGSKTGKGAISLQGHDPTTNLDFRNIRIVELPAQMK